MSLRDIIDNLLRRKQLIGKKTINGRTYEFWENSSCFELKAAEKGIPLEPIKGRKYRSLGEISDYEYREYLKNLDRESLRTDEYVQYLENKKRILSNPVLRAATPA